MRLKLRTKLCNERNENTLRPQVVVPREGTETSGNESWQRSGYSFGG